MFCNSIVYHVLHFDNQNILLPYMCCGKIPEPLPLHRCILPLCHGLKLISFTKLVEEENSFHVFHHLDIYLQPLGMMPSISGEPLIAPPGFQRFPLLPTWSPKYFALNFSSTEQHSVAEKVSKKIQSFSLKFVQDKLSMFLL